MAYMRSKSDGLLSPLSPTDDDFRERIAEQQEAHLLPLKEDLADWLNMTLDVDFITAENFMDKLDNGVIVCKLAKLIQTLCEAFQSSTNNKLVNNKVIPKLRFKVWANAKPESFFARENTENFLNWCRKFGVHEAVIFESDDLVLHTNPRIVVLCLLELGRVASKFNIEPPGLVQLEKEIDEQLDNTDSGNVSPNIPNNESPVTTASELVQSYENNEDEHEIKFNKIEMEPDLTSSRTPSPMPIIPRTLDLNDSCASESNVSILSTTSSIATTVSGSSCGDALTSSSKRRPAKMSELDQRIMDIASGCGCDKDKLKRVSEGKYCIGGKTVFVRLLKGRHVMVRVGGGWDTLEHFLSRHDPRQVIVMNRKGSTPDSIFTDADPFLHIKAKYRGSCTPISDGRAKTPTTPGTPRRWKSRPHSALYASHDHLAR